MNKIKFLIATVFTIVSVILSYQFFDKPIAFWMYKQPLAHSQILIDIVYWIPIIAGGILMILVPVFFVLKMKGMLNKKGTCFFYCTLTNLITNWTISIIKLCLGRYPVLNFSPKNIPSFWYFIFPGLKHSEDFSLIDTGSYGFNFFTGKLSSSDFPSGHMGLLCVCAVFIWHFAPRYRFITLIYVAFETVGLMLVGMHFLSDIIAGAFIGITISLFMIKKSKLENVLD